MILTRSAPRLNLIRSGLVARWTNDDADISGTTVKERYGGYDGTLSTSLSTATGKLGQAISYDGSNRMYKSHDAAFVTTALSLALWVKPTSLSGQTCLVVKTDDSGFNVCWGIYLNDTTFKPFAWIDGDGAWGPSASITGTTAAAISTWLHLVMTWANGAPVRIYANGSLEASSGNATVTLWSGNSAISVGWHPTFNPSGFNGLIDDVRFYNRALSAAEVSAIYNLRG